MKSKYSRDVLNFYQDFTGYSIPIFRFQEFYEDGERELLLQDVSELRDQVYPWITDKSTIYSTFFCHVS